MRRAKTWSPPSSITSRMTSLGPMSPAARRARSSASMARSDPPALPASVHGDRGEIQRRNAAGTGRPPGPVRFEVVCRNRMRNQRIVAEHPGRAFGDRTNTLVNSSFCCFLAPNREHDGVVAPGHFAAARHACLDATSKVPLWPLGSVRPGQRMYPRSSCSARSRPSSSCSSVTRSPMVTSMSTRMTRLTMRV